MKRILTALLFVFVFSAILSAQAQWRFLETVLMDGTAKSMDTMSTTPGFHNALLMARNHPKEGLGVVMHLGMNTFSATQSDFSVRAKFDNKNAEYYSVSYSQDYVMMFIMPVDVPRFLDNLKSSKKVLMEIGIYGMGKITLDFDARGFNYNRIK